MEPVKFVIKGRLPGLNEIISAINRHRHVGAKLKKETTEQCAYEIASQLATPVRRPVRIHFTWIEPNAKRDLDNISTGQKFVLDGLVMAGILPNDTRKWVAGLTHTFPPPDANNPRISVTMEAA